MKIIVNFLVTLLIWVYYFGSFVFFFSFWYLGALLFRGDREAAFQRINHYYYRSFFFLVRNLVPRVRFRIEKEVFDIRSSVIVCNHISYLDPILLISLFEKQKTIVKPVFFSVPIFGWVLRAAGYLPAAASGKSASLLVSQMDRLEGFLASGGNLFIFPEGTRSRTGQLGSFNDGAFKIARRCNAPVQVVSIRNTSRLFPPDRFLFNACVSNIIEVKHVGCIAPEKECHRLSVSNMKQQAWDLLNEDWVGGL